MCHSTHVTLFRLNLQPGESIFDQLVFAIKRRSSAANCSRDRRSLRFERSPAEFKIHPNTAHKVVQHLIQERWLEARPGIGTVVAEIPEPRPGDRKRLLQQEVEQLVVEAKRVGLDLARTWCEPFEDQWAKLERPQEVNRK